MSQLHNEGLRKQLVADKRTATADWSWLVSFEPINTTDYTSANQQFHGQTSELAISLSQFNHIGRFR